MKFMGRTIAVAALIAGSTMIAAPAHAAFALQNIGGGDGYVVTSPTGFDLFGADNDCFSCTTLYTDTATMAETLTFNYVYTTQDLSGQAYYDPAGFYLNGTFMSLVGDGLDSTYSGTLTENLAAGDVFGFYVSTDGELGRADIAVTVSAPPPPGVPEPASWAMMIAGFGLVGGAMRARGGARGAFGAA